jgi:hypothetical protein
LANCEIEKKPFASDTKRNENKCEKEHENRRDGTWGENQVPDFAMDFLIPTAAW